MASILPLAKKVLALPFPKRFIWTPYYWLVSRRYRSYLGKRLGPYFQPVQDAPTPPKDLVVQVGAVSQAQLDQMFRPGNGFPDRYRALGKITILKWLQTLEGHGFNLRTMGAVLEFGCGTGRLLQHFRNIDGIRAVGTDLNPVMVAWCQENLPDCAFHRNELEPPLAFAEADSFDLVYAYSVFTHIPVELQTPWLLEMKRILKPGGFLVCTVAGWWLERQLVGEEDREKLKKEGFVQYSSQDSHASLSTQEEGSHWDIYQTRREVIRVFGAHFQLRDYLPDAQDILILQKARPS